MLFPWETFYRPYLNLVIRAQLWPQQSSGRPVMAFNNLAQDPAC